MLKRLLLLLSFLFPGVTVAQNSQYFGIVLGPTGKPLAGARVTFCSNTAEIAIPCTTTINLFNYAGTPISNPQISDGRGNVNVWAPVGVYLMTVSGAGITPYRVVVNFPGGGGGGGSGTVGPGTVNFIAKFTGPTTVSNSTCFDDGVNPTRCPNGMNTAAGGNYDEYVVDTGGTLQGKLVVRSGTNKVRIAPAGTTNGVLGVAQSTEVAGSVVRVCWKDCNVIVANTTLQGDWMIPSVSVDGAADSVGTTRPTTGIVNFFAESSATAGNSVHTPLISLDTLGGTSGLGLINPCTQYGLTYYSAPGVSNTLNCINPPTANGRYFTIYDVNANAAVAPTTALAGIATRTVAGTTDTLLYSDRANKVNYTSNSNIAITVPQAGSTGFTSNTVFRTKVTGNGLATFTPTTSTVNGLATYTQTKGQNCTWYSDNSNYTTECWGSLHGLVFDIGAPGGTALTTSLTAYLNDLPWSCTLVRYAVAVDAGTVTVKFWKIASGTALPTNVNAINTSGVGVSSGTVNQSFTLSDFTTTNFTAHDILAMTITAVATAAWVQGTLSCAE